MIKSKHRLFWAHRARPYNQRKARYFPGTTNSLEVSSRCDKEGGAVRWRDPQGHITKDFVCAMQNGEDRTYLTVCCKLNDIISGKALTTLWGNCYCYPHFRYQETEAQKGLNTCRDYGVGIRNQSQAFLAPEPKLFLLQGTAQSCLLLSYPAP